MQLSVGQPNSAPQGGLAVAQAPIGMPATLSVQQSPTPQVGQPLSLGSNTPIAVPQPQQSPIVEAINTAMERGASPDQIIQKLAQSNPDKQTEFQTAIQRGAQPQDIINEVLKQNGGQATDTTANQTPTPEQPKSVMGYVGNTIGATGTLIKNVAEGLLNILNTNPDQNTVVNAAKIVGGLLQEPVALATGTTVKNSTFENFINNMSDRYGSWDKFKETLYKDTPGVLLDLSTVLDPAGKAISAVGEAGDLAKVTEAVSKLSEPEREIAEIGAKSAAKFNPGLLTKTGNAISSAAETINPMNAITKPIDWAKAGLENLAPKLEEANLRLTPTQQVNYASKLDDVTNYIAKEIPVGSPQTRFDAITQKAADMEDKVQTLLTQDAKDVTVPRDTLLQQVEGLKSEFGGERDALEIDKQIDGFKILLEAKYPIDIPVSDLNILKRSTFESAFNAAGTKVSDAVEYRLGDVLYDNLKTATQDVGGKTLQDLNKEYSTIITAKKLLKVAIGRPQVNFVDRLVTGAVGGVIGNTFGGPIGAAAGGFIGKTVAEHVPITGIRSVVGKVASKAAKIVPTVSPEVARGVGGMSRLSTYSKTPAKQSKQLGKR